MNVTLVMSLAGLGLALFINNAAAHGLGLDDRDIESLIKASVQTPKALGPDIKLNRWLPQARRPPQHEVLVQETLKTVRLMSYSSNWLDKDTWAYIRGVYWNDDPGCLLFTDNMTRGTDNFEAVPLSYVRQMERDLNDPKKRNNLLGQSHYGTLSPIHAMAPDVSWTPARILDLIRSWLLFEVKIARGSISASYTVRPSGNPLLSPIEKELWEANGRRAQSVESLFCATGAAFVNELQNRAIGSILHTIQDSYSRSHLQREGDTNTGRIIRFYTYNGQDKVCHTKHDASPSAVTSDPATWTLSKVFSDAQAKESFAQSIHAMQLIQNKSIPDGTVVNEIMEKVFPLVVRTLPTSNDCP